MSTRFAALCIAVVAIVVSGCCKTSPGGGCYDEGNAQCDGARMLVCKSHKWDTVSCAGPKGCVASTRFVDCDESLASVGMPCGTDPIGHSSCAMDHKTRLICDAGFWREDIICRGPKGCVVSGRYVDCDDSQAMVGDACDPDALACSMDSKSVLACRAGRFVVDHVCTGSRCQVSGNIVDCD